MTMLWENSFWAFFFITVVLGGGAGYSTGRALALKWRPRWQLLVYSCLLGGADRFLHWGLFLDRPLDVYKGELFSVQYYAVDTAVILLFASLGFRLTRTRQMTSQYRWLYRRTSPFTWVRREGDGG